jgi:hypothetical protein
MWVEALATEVDLGEKHQTLGWHAALLKSLVSA